MTSEKEQPREDTALSTEEWKQKYAELEVLFTEKKSDLHLRDRELEIEAALERVRSRTMAMHKSDELLEVIAIVAEQLKLLKFRFDNVSFAVKNQAHDYKFWLSAPGLPQPIHIHVPYINNPMFERVRNVADDNLGIYSDILTTEESRQWHQHVFDNSELQNLPTKTKKYILDNGYARTIIMMPTIMLIIGNYVSKPYTEEENNVFKRFARVFEQSYTRFLDLQKAEAQAREAQIEAALERVRSRSMAMHSSSEILEVAHTMYQQLKQLGFDYGGNTIMIMDKETGDMEWWMAGLGEGKFPEVYNISYFDHPVQNQILEDWKSGKKFSVIQLEGDLKKSYDDELFTRNGYKDLPEQIKSWMRQKESAEFSLAYMKHGALHWGPDVLSEEQALVLQRFARVFNQVYTRFLDLQKAEAQAREAQIEAALDRVRSSAMAMQSSRDLNTLVGKVFAECTRLDIQLDRGIIMIYDQKTRDVRWWMANPEAPDNPRDFLLQYHKHVPYLAFLESWKNRTKKWTYVLEGKEKEEWDAFLFVETELALLPAEVKQIMTGFKKVYLNSSFNNFGCLTLATLEPMTDSNFDILLRFAKVFDLTYTRFNDLKLAEAQAREAQIETALERIRAKALAMHQSGELMEVALTLREQMGLLGQKEMEASVIHFYNLKKNTIHSWHVLNTPGLEKGDVSAGSFEIKKNACQLTQQFFTEFQSEKNEYSIVAEREVLWEWLEYLCSISPDVKETLKDLEPEKVFFHFSKFSDGALLMVSTSPPTEESKYLQKRAALVFELAYKRYLDLKQAEKLARKAELDLIRLKEEKVKTEEALKELEATQAQLVQQEKLASLGQLTAGIAHEIKNPLNFVNNFSEVSLELIDEAQEEVKNSPLLRGAGGVSEKAEEGDQSQNNDVDSSSANTPLNPLSRGETGSSSQIGLILEILADIETNLRKIHEHGSRADSIVKSMLQHSRGGSGKILPTDLNAMVKEYVNLAYHGMRAGKDPISVDIDLSLDDSIGEVPLITEDFSRVIVNLCNNAFDAMREKLPAVSSQPSASYNYKPELTVRTKKQGDRVTVEIEDNGPGIPEEMMDKILQPFFTTKKGTDGTGLGLSITHDIVKAHRGELNIKSDGSGTIFQIIIPT